MQYQVWYDISCWLSNNCHYPSKWPIKNSAKGGADHWGGGGYQDTICQNFPEICMKLRTFSWQGVPLDPSLVTRTTLFYNYFWFFHPRFSFVLACSRPHSPVCSYRLQEIGVVQRVPLKEITIDVEMMNNFIRLIGKSQSGLLPPFRTMFPWERDAEGVSFRLKGICLIHANRSIIILLFSWHFIIFVHDFINSRLQQPIVAGLDIHDFPWVLKRKAVISI